MIWIRLASYCDEWRQPASVAESVSLVVAVEPAVVAYSSSPLLVALEASDDDDDDDCLMIVTGEVAGAEPPPPFARIVVAPGEARN